MALVGCSDDGGETATSYDQDESFMNLVHFVDAASSRIRQALDRPRRCRRRVNHRKYLAKILSTGVDVVGCTRYDHLSEHLQRPHSKPALSRSDHQSKRRPSQSVGRYSNVITTQSAAVGGESRSFVDVSRQYSGQISAGKVLSFNELDTDTSIAGYELPETVQTRCMYNPVSSSLYLTEPATDVSQGLPSADCRVMSTVSDEPYHSFFLHPAAVSLPQQLQQQNPQLAAGNSYCQTGFRQPYQCPASGLGYIHVDDGGDSSSRYLFDVPCSSAYPVLSSACDASEWLKDPSSSSWYWSYDHNDNEFYCSGYSTAQCVTSPCRYNSHIDVSNHDVTNVASLQYQQSTTSDFNPPYSPPTSVDLFQTPGRRLNDSSRPLHGQNLFVDASPSNFNDSGLGSPSFGSATDIDGSSLTDSPIFWLSNYGFLQPGATDRDSVFVQTVL